MTGRLRLGEGSDGFSRSLLGDRELMGNSPVTNSPFAVDDERVLFRRRAKGVSGFHIERGPSRLDDDSAGFLVGEEVDGDE